ncbi:hypothetical protein [Desulfobacca acetoxidans]|jgi:hypothetical protein
MRSLKYKTFPPRCPFCNQEIDPPQEFDDVLMYEFDGGQCACGASYCFDPTTRNGGAVMLQALVLACQGDWDRALSLRPDADYYEGRIIKYSALTHRVGDPASFGTIYFIRLRPQK